MSRLPFELAISKPCMQSWNEMSGAGAARHCAACDRTVHDLAKLTPREIMRLVDEKNRQLCARITRREDGSLVTARASHHQVPFGSAFVLASAVATVPVVAQEAAPSAATVTGTVLTPENSKYVSPDAPREVLFLQNDKAVLTVRTDPTGKFTASVPAGIYDLVFRNGPLFGERVKGAIFHPGVQEFAPIRERFNLGHLAEADMSTQEFVTMGELMPVYSLRVRDLFLHPMATVRALARRTKHHLHLSS